MRWEESVNYCGVLKLFCFMEHHLRGSLAKAFD